MSSGVSSDVTEKRLNCFTADFHAGQELPVMCDRDGCRKWEVSQKMNLCTLSFVTLLTDAGLGPLMFSLLSLSWRDRVNDSIQSLDHGTGKPKLHTATSFLLRLIPRNNTAGAPGKWERNVTFPFRLRGMWHSVDGFCRIGTPETRLSFFFWSRNVG